MNNNEPLTHGQGQAVEDGGTRRSPSRKVGDAPSVQPTHWMPLLRCPVPGCKFWVADGGYTGKTIAFLKTHVYARHIELPAIARRRDGGIVDELVAARLFRD